MKTLQIVGDSSYGGGTVLLTSWCKYLREKGCDVDVLTTDKKSIEMLNAIDGIKIINKIYIPRNIDPFKDFLALQKIIQLIIIEKYDVVQTYTATPGFIGRLAAWLCGTKVILHHQAAWAYTEARTPLGKIFFYILEIIPSIISTTNICVGKSVLDDAPKNKILQNKKLSLIRNGIDPTPYINCRSSNTRQTLRKELNFSEDTIVIGGIGRLAPLKNYSTLIYSIKYLKVARPNYRIKAIICGEGSEYDSLNRNITQLGLENDVFLLGFQNDVPSLLSIIDIYVSPTLREGLSISILEAMASALPIIVSSIPPNIELIENDVNGLLFPPNNPEALGESIIKYIEKFDFGNQCGKAAQKKVIEQYTIDRMFKETYSLYMRLLLENK